MKNLPSIALALLAAMLFAGCVAPDPGQDALVIRAEQTTSAAFAAFDNFLQWEHVNHTNAPAAAVKFADQLRDEAPTLIKAARLLTQTYKTTHRADHAASLELMLQTLDTRRAETLKMLSAPSSMRHLRSSTAAAVAPVIIIAAIDGLYRLIALITGLVANAKRTKEWTPEEEALVDAKIDEAFKSAHWSKQ